MTNLFERPQKVAFLIFERFSMVAFSSVIEPLRLANRILVRDLFTWSVHTMDGLPVTSSSEVKVTPDAALSELGKADIVLICTGVDVEKLERPPLLGQKLRALAARGAILGSLCTGTYILAKLKLLEKHRCTIHWENSRAFCEEFPHANLYQRPERLTHMTCAGGTAALDMMLMHIAYGPVGGTGAGNCRGQSP
ncbi:MAG: AraC family transcriptional regulator, partial [Cohaesibacter sp.]|nr:AraC family transcriptional regulator [Cohaesibacter sp.]